MDLMDQKKNPCTHSPRNQYLNFSRENEVILNILHLWKQILILTDKMQVIITHFGNRQNDMIVFWTFQIFW